MVELVGMVEVVGVARVVEVMRVVEVIRVGEVVGAVKVVRLVEVVRVVEVVYRCEENLGVKGPNNKNKDVGLPMTMPQAAGKNHQGIFDGRNLKSLMNDFFSKVLCYPSSFRM